MSGHSTDALEDLPNVLVLLAAYNGSQFITQQIETILAQTGVKVTLIISNDHSTDDTAAKIEPFLKDTRVKSLSPPQRTGSAAQNFFWLIGNAPADGYDFVSFSDQDDVWADTKLIRACTMLRRSGTAGYSCAVTAFWPDGKEKTLTQEARPTRSDFLFEGAGQGCTFVLRADFYVRVRDFLAHHPSIIRDIHFHDWTTYALSRCWGEVWSFDPDPMLRYRQHRGNDTGARSSAAGIARRLNKIRDGWYSRQLQLMAAVCAVASPTRDIYRQWNRLLGRSRGVARVLRIAYFCFCGGRRRTKDNVALILSTLVGWI